MRVIAWCIGHKILDKKKLIVRRFRNYNQCGTQYLMDINVTKLSPYHFISVLRNSLIPILGNINILGMNLQPNFNQTNYIEVDIEWSAQYLLDSLDRKWRHAAYTTGNPYVPKMLKSIQLRRSTLYITESLPKNSAKESHPLPSFTEPHELCYNITISR